MCFVLGACAGGAGTYFVVKRKLERKFDKELNDISSFYVEKYIKSQKNEEKSGKLGEKVDENVKKTMDWNLQTGEIKTSEGVVSSLNNDFKSEEYKKSYSTMFIGDGNMDGKLADPRPEIKDIVPKLPVRISKGEFENGGNKQIFLTYYEESGVLATLDDMESDYDEDYFGLDNLSKFGDNNEEYDEDLFTIHLRNVDEKLDFEIYYEPNLSWYEVKYNTGGCK